MTRNVAGASARNVDVDLVPVTKDGNGDQRIDSGSFCCKYAGAAYENERCEHKYNSTEPGIRF